MSRVVTPLVRAAALVSIAVSMWLAAAALYAQSIDVSLNVLYSNPANVNSGGVWELVAKSSHSGIAGVSLLVTNIATAQNEAPRGLVNGSDLAGFSQFFNTAHPNGFRNLTIGQVPIPPGGLGAGEEQSVFYGVGTLSNGAPNYPGKPAGSQSIGPAFSSLAFVQDVPWATGDIFGNAAWSTAARLASGTFAAGLTPAFSAGTNDIANTGNVFTSVGTSLNYGAIAAATISTTVRTNFSASLLPDYNRNGVVDAADYVLWRNTQGATGAGLPADGNGDGTVNQADYNLWRASFGALAGSASAAGLSTSVVPEPASGLLFVLGAVLVAGRWLRTRTALGERQ